MPSWLYHTVLVAGLLALIGLEMRGRSFRAGAWGIETARVRRNWAFLVAALVTTSLLKQVADAAAAVVPPLVSWEEHVVLNLIGCFLVAELFGWTLHWVKHKHPWLWRLHFQHHRESRFDIWLTTHTHGLEVLASGTITAVAMAALGFSPLSMQVYLLYYAFANVYQHSSFDYSLGWLDKIVVGPAYHRYHHAVGSAVNFGETMTFWDVVFRTARWPVSTKAPNVPIGMGDAPEPYGFASEMLHFLDAKKPVAAEARS